MILLFLTMVTICGNKFCSDGLVGWWLWKWLTFTIRPYVTNEARHLLLKYWVHLHLVLAPCLVLMVNSFWSKIIFGFLVPDPISIVPKIKKNCLVLIRKLNKKKFNLLVKPLNTSRSQTKAKCPNLGYRIKFLCFVNVSCK